MDKTLVISLLFVLLAILNWFFFFGIAGNEFLVSVSLFAINKIMLIKDYSLDIM